jgi:3-dehydroquinate dehydratase-2
MTVRDSSARIAVVNGPTLNLLGVRETSLYGDQDLKGIEDRIRQKAESLGVEVEFFQSNHEGEIIDYIHSLRGRVSGIVLNPAGLAHSSVSLRDALLAVGIPFVEVHITNIFSREEFRRISLTADIARGFISGLGGLGYLLALESLLENRSR